MIASRELTWDGCFNVRDIGGLPTVDGRMTRSGAVIRSEQLDALTATGWAALEEHGVRTIVDLRNDNERGRGAPPAGIASVHVPLDDESDFEFWQHCWRNDLDGSPLYYRPFLDRKAERCAAAVAAVARAGPGGVLVHCGGGRDRTGLVTLLLLALAHVEPEEIVADYELSNVRLAAFWAARGEQDQAPLIARIMERKQTSPRALLLDLLAWLDVEAYLLGAGLCEDDLESVRARLLD